MIGFAATPREPSLVWQAAQTDAESAAPLAGSGALAAGSAACAATLAHASISERRRLGTVFM
jgi:hypothetical protein